MLNYETIIYSYEKANKSLATISANDNSKKRTEL